jgi:hypothetical protein
LALVLWTNIFGALGIGVCLKRILTRTAKPLNILSLPLAVLVFSIVAWGFTALFITYGLFPSAIQACRNNEMFLLSYCGVVRLEGFYFSILGIVILIISGTASSTESPLIRACSTYRHAAKLRLIIGLGVAAFVIGALIDSLPDPRDWWRYQTIVSFAIAGICLTLFFLAALFKFHRMQELQQLSNAHEPKLDWPLVNSQRMPVNEVNYAQPRAGSLRPPKRYVSSELDVQALKEAIKNRRRHFEQ